MSMTMKKQYIIPVNTVCTIGIDDLMTSSMALNTDEMIGMDNILVRRFGGDFLFDSEE